MIIPCKKCPVLPVCINKVSVVCSTLFDYFDVKEDVNGQKVNVSYTKFIEAQQILINMQNVAKEASGHIGEDYP